MGTANLREGVRRTNREWAPGYRENDELGGLDPYSSSKACQKLVVASYRESLMARDA